jgi:hypothetical protein
MGSKNKTGYARKVLPGATFAALRPPVRGPVHLIIAVADHFEPAISAEGGRNRVGFPEQEQRLERWICEYPAVVDRYRDHDGRPFIHTYFYPAEQYHEGLLEMLAEHCHAGWGEAEIHLHHGHPDPDTAENTRQTLTEFRDRLAFRHRCLAADPKSGEPSYCFVHGDFALANSAEGHDCGVDSEMQILAETGCYADFTLPTGIFHSAQISKMNSIYECGLPLQEAVPHRVGKDLEVGRAPRVFPVIVQGPLLADLTRTARSLRPIIETGAITQPNPMTLHRLSLWKRARVQVAGRPDWLFIKLHCHSMEPAQKDAVIGEVFRRFLAELVGGAGARQETLHFVSAREMTNIILATCDGKGGDPGEYRDYRFRRFSEAHPVERQGEPVPTGVKD